MFHSTQSVPSRPGRSSRFASFRALAFALALALLVQVPASATDPIDIDPNPDSTFTLILQEGEPLVTSGLAPGHYLVIVIHADGSQTSYEIWVK
ncbi:MAG: hypothetical protein AAF725_17450 [Acidobacteriota bacterium]